ncbi:MAG: hypothetical protein HETSPECPRED_007815 [Heterodermia speciosa]|uniref:Transmembrane protein n=1 Tax=Heterodermia speciosa TaxID=116794 RepID=A0A8H3IWI4_9LECA|nr:MAG: hypothetical protein HETSPECPRED_007815 [Heterodermia speciosa]
MSHAMEEEPMSQYDLDEETVMTPVQTRAVSPSRGRVMPHTAAEADAFTASLNTIVNGKDNGPAHAALSLFDKTRAFFNTFSLVDKAAFILYITVFTLTMAGIQVANYGCTTICMTVAAIGLSAIGLILVILRLQDSALAQHADLEA